MSELTPIERASSAATASKAKKPTSIGARIWRILSGYEIAVACLSLLFILTFFGTIEQKWFGLWTTVHKYFDPSSFFVIPRNSMEKIIFLPLPGTYWVIVVLCINMFCGGIIRMRKGWKKAGVLVSHFAILFMLIAGAVSSVYKEEGHMLLYQGRKSDYAQTNLVFDIEVFKYNEKGEREAPAIIDDKYLEQLSPDDSVTATFEKFPFTAKVDSYLPESSLSLVSADNQPKKSEEILDGFFLTKAKKDIKTEEKNLPGCYVTIQDDDGGKIQRLVLWAGNPYPVTFSHEGALYGVTITRKVWPMPFEVELHKTVGEYHPGTQIPRWFQSDITMIYDGQRSDHEIYMNFPARQSGFTLYQAGWEDGGEEPFSVLAIVKNPSDKWPEWALYVSTIALGFHFIIMLGLYASGNSPRSRKSAAAPVKSTPPPLKES